MREFYKGFKKLRLRDTPAAMSVTMTMDKYRDHFVGMLSVTYDQNREWLYKL